MTANLTMHDLFSGAGGSTSGAVDVPGVAVRLAVNHSRLAVDSHNQNHPDTDHLCANVSETDPRYLPRADLLWASPECVNHSQAKGVKRAPQMMLGENGRLPDEAAVRSRATMWDVPRYAEAHGYRGVIVENVTDARWWVLWPAWVQAMRCLGYEHRVVYLNSAYAQAGRLPAPQSRDRCTWSSGKRGSGDPTSTSGPARWPTTACARSRCAPSRISITRRCRRNSRSFRSRQSLIEEPGLSRAMPRAMVQSAAQSS